jgi:hypothetical protein
MLRQQESFENGQRPRNRDQRNSNGLMTTMQSLEKEKAHPCAGRASMFCYYLLRARSAPGLCLGLNVADSWVDAARSACEQGHYSIAGASWQ